MKTTTKTFIFASIIIFILFLSSCRILVYNIPNIDDYKIFPGQTIEHNEKNVFHFKEAKETTEFGNSIFVSNRPLGMKLVDLNTFCDFTNTAAFLIIRNDSIISEYYGDGYGEANILNPFSITKAFITTLTGIALNENNIESVDDPISKYLDEYKDSEVGEVKIRQLLKHTSGIKFNDSNLGNARYYYGKHLRKYLSKLELETTPGTEYKYSSANTQLLAMVLERTAGTSLSDYLETKLWKEIGMQYDALWSLDKKGKDAMEKAFSGLNSNPTDLAKLGRLYLNNGKWGNKTILTKEFIEEATKRDISEGSRWDYQYNFGVGPKKYNSFFAVGFYGQLVYVYPEKQIIMVRIAEKDTHYNPPFCYYIMTQIIDQL